MEEEQVRGSEAAGRAGAGIYVYLFTLFLIYYFINAVTNRHQNLTIFKVLLYVFIYYEASFIYFRILCSRF